MNNDVLVGRFFDTLISGDRVQARAFIREQFDSGSSAALIFNNLCFPVYEKIEQLFRADQLTDVGYHLSTRLLRMIVDQVASQLPMQTPNGQTVFAVCGPSQSEELAAQMTVDLVEAAGCQVTFCGGGVPGDEVLAQVHARRPDVLLIFAPAASDLPAVREIIDHIREIGAVDRTRIVVGGGVFNRAEGLAEEIHCDLWASTPLDIVSVVLTGKMTQGFSGRSVAAKIGTKTRAATKRAA